MNRGIFIAGNESAISRAVENETGSRVEQYSAALIPNRLSSAPKNSPQEMKKRLALEWNPSSPISARTLLIAAENRIEHIDNAILICSPPSIRSSASELPLPDVEIFFNDQVKGWFFLIKEITALFSSRKQGTLALVYPDINTHSSKDEAADVLGPSALASFRALTQGLLAAAHNEPYVTAGFSTSDAGNEAAFAAFIYKNIDEITKRTNGKLHKFGKFSFFK
ncbi:MAG: hypothetical protein FWC22_03290 [Treponema sp.]|nr:hypothetical protein [Treponema sp.]